MDERDPTMCDSILFGSRWRAKELGKLTQEQICVTTHMESIRKHLQYLRDSLSMRDRAAHKDQSSRFMKAQFDF